MHSSIIMLLLSYQNRAVMGCCTSSLSNKPPLRKPPPVQREDLPRLTNIVIDNSNSCRKRNVLHVVVEPEELSDYTNLRIVTPSPESFHHTAVKPINNDEERPLDISTQQQGSYMMSPRQEIPSSDPVPTPLLMRVDVNRRHSGTSMESNVDYPASQARDSVGSGVPNEGNELRRRGPSESEGGSFHCNPDDPLFEIQT